MKKITPQLAKLIGYDSGKVYSVVIVCSPNNEFLNTKFKKLMDGLFSAEISGHEIEKLALRDEVLSIELNNIVGI